jgi:hypothetical protein
MADKSVPVPLPGEVPFIPQTPEQAAQRDSAAGLPHAAVTGPPIPVPTRMSVGSPVADDALFGALETAHDFITRTTAWKGHESERQEVLELTATALQAIAAPIAP